MQKFLLLYYKFKLLAFTLIFGHLFVSQCLFIFHTWLWGIWIDLLIIECRLELISFTNCWFYIFWSTFFYFWDIIMIELNRAIIFWLISWLRTLRFLRIFNWNCLLRLITKVWHLIWFINIFLLTFRFTILGLRAIIINLEWLEIILKKICWFSYSFWIQTWYCFFTTAMKFTLFWSFIKYIW